MTSESTAAQALLAFPRGAQELSAARLARDVASSLSRAAAARPRKQKDLARELGVSEGAVSQVLNGDGNVRVATLARYLRAMGYEARLQLAPVEPGMPELAAPARRGRRGPSTQPVQLGTLAASADTTWTVLDAEGEVFGVRVKVTGSTVPGTAHFSGQCQLDVVRMARDAPARVVTSGPLGSVLQERNALLQEAP